ncbi:sensor histidine kinase [Cognatilysobacter bugurensis]|uniref:histidine kinase n=1 Tax=Cognatilysobacter bugurensis TaxID=543356 RepID=A0A918W765_9GAMM|nr:HAMP domain-containing sensor histidine kinase [Lysobacter bugurensis]GHA76069.1 two-component sensor histidine kinase [Lysobacter bugurensis]
MRTLAQFLRSHRETIMREWLARSSQLPSARGVSIEGQRDHIPHLLDAMAEAIERGDTSSVSLEQLPLLHADHRLSQDYGLREVVAEYRLLRRVVLDVYAEHATDMSPESRTRLPPLVTFNENVDHAITDAVDHYMLQRERMREYFVGMLSHDLRDPLNAISLTAEMLLRFEGREPAERQLLERMRGNTQRMSRLIADMLDVTRSRLGGGLPITPGPADLGEIVCATVDELSAGQPERCIECRLPTDDEDLTGQWDAMRVGQAVSNLVANAIKHGGDPICVTTADEGAYVALEVANRGEIPVELRARVFEPFSTRDASAGTGLGLFIVAEIARVHGGVLRLVPETPGETRFRLELPRIAPTPAAASAGEQGT